MITNVSLLRSNAGQNKKKESQETKVFLNIPLEN